MDLHASELNLLKVHRNQCQEDALTGLVKAMKKTEVVVQQIAALLMEVAMPLEQCKM